MKDRYLDVPHIGIPERRKTGDRRKAINSLIDPKFERRRADRRTTDDYLKMRKKRIQALKDKLAKKDRRRMISAGIMFIVSIWFAAYLITDWIVMY